MKVAARRELGPKDRFWIVSPNMEYIPEQPGLMDQPDVMNDGLLGLYEWTEHPRNFLFFRPHEALIRVTPVGVAEKTILTQTLRKIDLVWDNLRPVGSIHEALLGQIDAEYRRVMDKVDERWPYALTANTLPHHSRQHALLTRMHLKRQSLLWGHAVTFWRQWQRSLRDLLAWCDWYDLMRCVVVDPKPAIEVDTRLRGVFTADPNVVKMYMFLGIPVWYILELQAFLPTSCIVPIQSWKVNARLDTHSAEEDWTIPDMFRNVFDIYGPFRLPLTENQYSKILKAPRKNMEYSSEVVQNPMDSSHDSLHQEMDGKMSVLDSQIYTNLLVQISLIGVEE